MNILNWPKLTIPLYGCFFTLTLPAQNKEVITYNDLPLYGIDLAEGWRYSPADDPAYAKPDFADNSWDTIHPSKKISELSPELEKGKIGWLRLHFKIGPALGEKTLLLALWQNCASEIYLDGKLVRRYGVLNNDLSKVIPIGMNQPVEAVHLTPGKEHVLAVRFAIWKGAFLLKANSYFFFLNMTDISNFQATQKTTNSGNESFFVLVAIFFLLSLLHLSFYKHDPTQRANFFFAIYTITSMFAFLLVCAQAYVADARFYALVYVPSFMISIMGGIWTVKALSSLFNLKTRRLVITMWGIYVISLIAIVTYEINIPFYATLLIFQLINAWLAVKALLSNKRGAGIIAAGFFTSLAITIISASDRALGLSLDLLIGQTLVGLIFFTPAVGISLYLAREFALNSNLLREKLLQVEALSARSLAHEQEKRQLLASQNDELETLVSERTTELQASLNNLRSAQAQLVQSEKMASLGELTAGIAHEIQNPLNFVNNFSEVSSELADELTEELDKGEVEEAKAIAADIKQNLEKINQHGKRADSIVKGMLEHSRTSSGEKVPTDINKLADEYLRLAYHGLRAKDKAFNARLVSNFAGQLPLANMVSQHIGRVLLNLFNNAFYAVQQQQNIAGPGYDPVVEVTTGVVHDHIVITIKDNGTGIPDAIKDKVMQPFFTTKPSGQGTGLGLSLSYDIVVKGHNGKFDLASKQNEGTVFTISLPL